MAEKDCEFIEPKSLPITNKKVLDILSVCSPWGGRILDLGAGKGYFSSLLVKQLDELGFKGDKNTHLFACDLYPHDYKVSEIKCSFCDLNGGVLPYEDGYFDAVCSIEVIEHLENHFKFISEIYRILKPGGVAVLTTPNILNINSRLKFFFTGFPYLFDPLPLSTDEHVETGGHINPISYYHLKFAMYKTGFKETRLYTDRFRHSGIFYLLFSYIPIKIGHILHLRNLKKIDPGLYTENRDILRELTLRELLLGRTVIIKAVKPA
jgi:SAM-dependent methyltransferase